MNNERKISISKEEDVWYKDESNNECNNDNINIRRRDNVKNERKADNQ